MKGTPHDVYGNMVVVTSRHPVAFAMTVSGPATMRSCLAMMTAPHPTQARWPPLSNPLSVFPSSLIFAILSFDALTLAQDTGERQSNHYSRTPKYVIFSF